MPTGLPLALHAYSLISENIHVQKYAQNIMSISDLIRVSFIDKRFLIFLAVGVLNTFVGYSLYALFLALHLHYSLASLFATFLCVLFNFKSTGYLVFKNKQNNLIFKFVGGYTVVYFLNLIGLKIFDVFRVNMYLAGAVLLVPMAMTSFLINKNIVFK